MDIDDLRTYCLAKSHVTEDFPFDEQTLAFRVFGKIFLLCDIFEFPLIANLKCDPEYAIELREKFNSIQPGWHMNKKHWNTVTFNNELNIRQLKELIDHSYDRVLSGVPKSKLK